MAQVHSSEVIHQVSVKLSGGSMLVNKIRLLEWQRKGVNIASLISGPTIALIPRMRTHRYIIRSLTNNDQLTTRPVTADDFEVDTDLPEWKRWLLTKGMLKGPLVIEPKTSDATAS